MSERYPLSWPDGWKRTAPSVRTWGRFSKRETVSNGTSSWKRTKEITVAEAVKRIQYELQRLGVEEGDALISTNLKIRLDGLPRSDQQQPSDPGAAVYWQIGQKKQCMAIDRYTSVADNLAAIAATLDALRAIERHGGGEILDRAFQGFAALPERAGGRGWREVFEVGPQDHLNADAIRTRFNALAHKVHPDKPGGDRDKFEELMWARDAAFREIGEIGA